MKGFPKTINTREDLYNCYELVKNGTLEKENLLNVIAQIERRNYIFCPVMAIDETKKIITLRYCAEAAAGQTLYNDGTSYNISTVQHQEATNKETGNTEYTATIITVTKIISSIAEKVGIPAPVSVYEELGMTQAEMETMKGGLA